MDFFREFFKEKGLLELHIRDVPMGDVLNRETAELYPLIWSGSWLDKEYKWLINVSYIDTSNKLFDLYPNTMEFMIKIDGKSWNGITHEEVIKIIKEYENN